MSRTLHVNVEYQILTRQIGLFEGSAVSSIIVPKYLSVFEKFAPKRTNLKLLARDKVVILTGPLSVAKSASSV